MRMSIEPEDLPKIWTAPDNTRLTPKQMSIRLPLHVAAKISALSEMFPKKTKTEIIGDLLAAALDQVEGGLSNKPYSEEEHEPDGQDPDTAWGERRWYGELVDKYLKEMGREAGEAAGSEETEVPRRQEGKGRPRGASVQGRGKRVPRVRGASARASK